MADCVIIKTITRTIPNTRITNDKFNNNSRLVDDKLFVRLSQLLIKYEDRPQM